MMSSDNIEVTGDGMFLSLFRHRFVTFQKNPENNPIFEENSKGDGNFRHLVTLLSPFRHLLKSLKIKSLNGVGDKVTENLYLYT
jgi:hypothetical protein